jgi:RimJ/RimL family protein N-acetyltransferase
VDREAEDVITPPYRIVTERLVVRCWEPRDAPLLKQAVDTSIDLLLPWMPWARDEPQTLDEKVELLRGFRGRFDLGQDFVYAIFSADETEVVGGTGLHTRGGEHAFEIGYWISAARAGNGYATEATAALTRVGLDFCNVDRIEIRVDPANEASRKVPRKLGYAEEATLRRRLSYPDVRDVVIYTLFRDELPSTPSASAAVEAYDAAGKRVL